MTNLTLEELLVDKVATAKSLAAEAEQYALDGRSADVVAVLRRLAETTASATRTAVEHMRRFGASWQDVADEFGITRQAAQERFSR